MPFCHPERMEIGASCMCPPVGTWGNSSACSWVLLATPGPAPLTLGAQGAAVGQAGCWHHPNLAEVEKSCVGTSHSVCSKHGPWGDVQGSLGSPCTGPSSPQGLIPLPPPSWAADTPA